MSNDAAPTFDTGKLKAYLLTHAPHVPQTGYLVAHRDPNNLRGGPIRVKLTFQNSSYKFALMDAVHSLQKVSAGTPSDCWGFFNAEQFIAGKPAPHLVIADALDNALYKVDTRWELDLDRWGHYIDPQYISTQASMAANIRYFLRVFCRSIQYQSTTHKPVALDVLFAEDRLAEMYETCRVEPTNYNRGYHWL